MTVALHVLDFVLITSIVGCSHMYHSNIYKHTLPAHQLQAKTILGRSRSNNQYSLHKPGCRHHPNLRSTSVINEAQCYSRDFALVQAAGGCF